MPALQSQGDLEAAGIVPRVPPGTDDPGVSEEMKNMFPYVWFWRVRLPERKGQACRVVARGKMNSILVEFIDGWKVVTSRYAVRKSKDQ